MPARPRHRSSFRLRRCSEFLSQGGENCLADPEMETGVYPGIRVYLKAECTRPWQCRSKSTSPRATASRPAPSPTTTHSCSTGGSVRLMSYPLETALAKKFETVVSRGVTSTRPCDLYDMHLLWRARGDRCGIPTLREALESTCAKRGSSGAMARWRPVLDEVAADKTMLALWGRYAKKNPPTRRHRAGAVLRDGKRDTGRARMRAVEFRNAIPDFRSGSPARIPAPGSSAQQSGLTCCHGYRQKSSGFCGAGSQRAVLPYFFLAFRPALSGQALCQAACMRRPRMRNS